MKKSLLLTAIILWVIVATAITGFIVFAVNGGGLGVISGNNELIKYEEILLGSTQNVVVEGIHQAVELRKTTGDNIKVSQYGSTNTADEKLFSVTAEGDLVHIYINTKWHFSLFNFSFNERLVIELPENYTGNLDATTSSGGLKMEDELTLKNVNLTTSSGGIRINNNLTANMLNLSTSSGGIRTEGNITVTEDITVKSTSGGITFNGLVTASNLNAQTSSGGIRSDMAIKVDENIKFKSSSGGLNITGDVTAKDLEAKTSSGGITLGLVDVEKYFLQSSSGGIKAENISGGGEAKASSGGINLSLKEPKGDIKLTANSGKVHISLEESLEFTLDAKANSGSIRSDFDVKTNSKGNKATAEIGNDPTTNITISTSSGGIRIESK